MQLVFGRRKQHQLRTEKVFDDEVNKSGKFRFQVEAVMKKTNCKYYQIYELWHQGAEIPQIGLFADRFKRLPSGVAELENLKQSA